MVQRHLYYMYRTTFTERCINKITRKRRLGARRRERTSAVSNHGRGNFSTSTWGSCRRSPSNSRLIRRRDRRRAPTGGCEGLALTGFGRWVRFGDRIVSTRLDGGSIRCVAPRSPPGLVRLSVSTNDQDYVPSFPFTFYGDPATNDLLPVGGPSDAVMWSLSEAEGLEIHLCCLVDSATRSSRRPGWIEPR